MPDLSNLLGAVYGDGPATSPRPTADDTSGPASDKPRFDFSVPADDHDEANVDDEPFAAFAPKPVAEYAPRPVADLEPPSNLSKFEIAPDERPQTTQVHDLGEVVE